MPRCTGSSHSCRLRIWVVLTIKVVAEEDLCNHTKISMEISTRKGVSEDEAAVAVGAEEEEGVVAAGDEMGVAVAITTITATTAMDETLRKHKPTAMVGHHRLLPAETFHLRR